MQDFIDVPIAEVTADELAPVFNLSRDDEKFSDVGRLIEYAKLAIERRAPEAPNAVGREALIRLVGYLLDQPPATRYYPNALRSSGADGMLLPWRIHRAGIVEEVTDA